MDYNQSIILPIPTMTSVNLIEFPKSSEEKRENPESEPWIVIFKDFSAYQNKILENLSSPPTLSEEASKVKWILIDFASWRNREYFEEFTKMVFWQETNESDFIKAISDIEEKYEMIQNKENLFMYAVMHIIINSSIVKINKSSHLQNLYTYSIWVLKDELASINKKNQN